MPVRPMSREQMWMLPPTLDELVPADHPARFVGDFVDALSRDDWADLGVDTDGSWTGAPSYHPSALLGVWLYGFMTGVRPCRKLEAACRDQIPYLWLTGWQRLDHNTLWRIYKSHRRSMRKLLRRTVQTAVRMELVELALQAVDGTKVGANATGARSLDAEELGRLLRRLEKAITELEAQNEAGEDGAPVHMPEELSEKEALRERVRTAMDELTESFHLKHVNLTDMDARLMKTRQGIVPGYNAQVMVSPTRSGAGVNGMLITATEVTDDPDDHSQLVTMLQKAEETTGVRSEATLADAGYHSGSNLQKVDASGHRVVMPEAQGRRLDQPYLKDRFIYDETTDSYICPQGQRLGFIRIKRTGGRRVVRVYRSSGVVCRDCPAFGVCTRDGRHGRAIEVGPHDTTLRSHRAWMSTDRARQLYTQRKHLVEPVFGIIKEQHQARRFLLRGIDNVRAEWGLLAVAFNLRTLWRAWRGRAIRARRRNLGISLVYKAIVVAASTPMSHHRSTPKRVRISLLSP